MDDDRDSGPGRTLATVGVLGAAGYFGYRWWQREQLKAALYTDAQRQLTQNPGMSIKDALTNAAAGACVAAAAAKLKMDPKQAGPMCQGLAVIATKAVEVTAKGAIIVGKAVGKGTVAATRAIGKAGSVVGKGIGKGAKAVVYTAPKKLLSGAVKPVKAVGKVAKKVACLGIFCGLDGLEDADAALYRSAVDLALAGVNRNPMRNVKASRTKPGRRADPFRAMARSPRPTVGAASLPRVRVAGRSRSGGQSRSLVGGAAYYESLLGR